MLSGFVQRLRERDSVSSLALEFLILTAARTGEVIGAKWDEIDLAGGVWTIPAARMKAHKEHRVPLSDRAVEILVDIKTDHKAGIGDFVFPGAKEGQPLSNMAMLELLKGMDGNGYTVHRRLGR